MKLRLDLDQRTATALIQDAVANLRSVPWQAEWILRKYLLSPVVALGRMRASDTEPILEVG